LALQEQRSPQTCCFPKGGVISPCERLLFPHNDHTIRSLVFPARLGLARTALLADCSFPKGQCDFAWFENPLPSTTAPPIEATVHRAAFGNAQINLVLAENPLPPVRFGVLTDELTRQASAA